MSKSVTLLVSVAALCMAGCQTPAPVPAAEHPVRHGTLLLIAGGDGNVALQISASP
jgi:hypothetical protein